MGNSTTPGKRIGALLDWEDAERRQAVQRRTDQARERILAAAGIDPQSLSSQALRVLDWLAEGAWLDESVDGIVELLTATRTAGYPDRCLVGLVAEPPQDPLAGVDINVCPNSTHWQ